MDSTKDLPLVESDPRWLSSIASLETQMETYRKLENTGASQAQIDAAAERINATIHTISGRAPPSYPDIQSSPGHQTEFYPCAPVDETSPQSTQPSHLGYPFQASTSPRSPRSTAQQGNRLSKLHRPARDVFFDDGSNNLPSSGSGAPKKRNPVVRVARGMLVVTVAPLAAAGMGLYVCGMALEGAAEVLKGIGSLGKLAMVNVRGKDKHASASPRH